MFNLNTEPLSNLHMELWSKDNPWKCTAVNPSPYVQDPNSKINVSPLCMCVFTTLFYKIKHKDKMMLDMLIFYLKNVYSVSRKAKTWVRKSSVTPQSQSTKY